MKQIVVLLICAIPSLVRADGYVIAARQADITVLVPDRIIASANMRVHVQAPQDALTEVSLVPSRGVVFTDEYCGRRGIVAARAMQGAASLTPPAAGNWTLEVFVRRGADTTTISCPIRVEPARRLATIWPYLASPPVAIALFAMNQIIRTKGSRTWPPN